MQNKCLKFARLLLYTLLGLSEKGKVIEKSEVYVEKKRHLCKLDRKDLGLNGIRI